MATTEASHIIWTCIVAYASVQGFLLFLIFPTYQFGSRQAKWLLATASLLCSILLTEELLSTLLSYQAYPHLIFSVSPLWYLISPVIFLYIRLHTQDSRVSIKDVWHFIPALWIFVSTLNFYSLDGATKLWYIEHASQGYVHPIHNINFIIFSVQSTFYLLMSWLLLKKERKVSRKKMEDRWITQLVVVLALIAASSFCSVFVLNSQIHEVWWSGSIYFVVVTGFLLALFVQSIRSPQELYLMGKPLKIKSLSTRVNFSESYQALLNYLKEQRPYIDPNYDIQTLSRQLGYSKHYLTQLIKESTGLNFRDFMNEFRLEEAKKKLASPISRQFTIQSIAIDSGFNSLATFYRAFKKLEGKPPKSFIQ